jgi:nucleoside-diphosphate-sugar epimerase
MRVLITGANGYLGQQLSLLFIKANFNVIEVVRQPSKQKMACDLLEPLAVSKLIKQAAPDLIVHCAAFVPKQLSEYNSSELSSQNSKMLENIINFSDCPIAYISSMTVYGDSLHAVRCEDDLANPESEYGISKYAGELLLNNAQRNSLSIRIPGLFGGARDTGLVANVLKSLANGLPLTLPTAPLIWAAMDVRDAAESIFKLCQSQFSNASLVNVSYNEVYSINRLLKICEEIYDKKIEYRVVHPDFSFDLTKLKTMMAVPKRNLKDALLEHKKLYA